ncbi:hypothetical protein, partial [Propioniciclava sp.]|uniref:hypothetical protein n=1 Tax=Propioniciclava sp. TaxID=2038686 RepID=UPI00261E4B61
YANHVHLEVVGDGDAHSLIRPEAIIPPTATDLLERILARDEDNTSATTTARTLADPANRLADAVARYSDALGYAALVWRTSVLLDPLPDSDDLPPDPADAPRTSAGLRTPISITQWARQRRTTSSRSSNRTWP